MLFAIWVMYEGLSLSISSFGYKKAQYKQWWIMLLFGLLNVLLGYLAFINAADISAFLAVCVGLGVVSNGVMRIIAFIAIGRIEKRLKESSDFDSAEIFDDEQSEKQ